MVENRLYDTNSIEFSELIDNARIELENNNLEYKKLSKELHEIMDRFPNLQLLLEDDKVIMRKYEPSCVFCASTVGLMEYRGKNVCAQCIRAMIEND